MKIMVEISARHIHLSEKDFFAIFGENKSLTLKKQLSQPGQFVCFERVDVSGPKDTLKGISILGPFRKETQLELSLTDARKMGIAAPVRESGDLDGTPGCRIAGPAGEIEIKRGVIAAKRHIHIRPKDAENSGLKNGQIVSVKINSEERSLIFDETVVRVHDEFLPALHIDTDEANAAGIKTATEAEII
jgi:putative phosphotransacetylase